MLRRTAVLVVAAGVVFGACGGGQSATERAAKARADQARQVARRAGLPVAVQDFLARYAASAARSFTVNYAPDQGGTTIVLTQSPPDRRLDLVRGGVTESFFAGQGSFDCVLQGRAWTCTSTSTEAGQLAPLAAADVDRTVAALKASRASFTFRVVARRLAGTPASCLETVPRPGAGGGAASGPTSLCISPEGAPLLVQGQATQLRATRYTTDVDKRRLRLPAPPTPVTTTR